MAEVVIRLKRTGAVRKPRHRIVVISKHQARDSKPLEELGYYNPTLDPPLVRMNLERARYWIGKGAHPSPTVKQLMKRVQKEEGSEHRNTGAPAHHE